jgi:hypothetical protein
MSKRATKAKRGRGQPSGYGAHVIPICAAMAKLGATDAQMAKALQVCEKTFNNWKTAHPQFLQSLKAAKEDADAKVEQALYSRAVGGSVIVQDAKVLKDGAVVKFDRVEVMQPDVTACIFWLKNRKAGQWRDKIDHTVAGGDGKSAMTDLAVEVAAALARDEVAKHVKT